MLDATFANTYALSAKYGRLRSFPFAYVLLRVRRCFRVRSKTVCRKTTFAACLFSFILCRATYI